MTQNSQFGYRRYAALMLLALCSGADAAELKYDISGIENPLLDNVQSHLNAFSIQSQADVTEDDVDDILESARLKTEAALKPFGYYNPTMNGEVTVTGDGDARVKLRIDTGPPIIVDQVNIELVGEGAEHSTLVQWRNSWPLKAGQILDQTVWEERKQFAVTEAGRRGYLAAEYSIHKLEIDLETNRADIWLTLDTGARFYFGDITFSDHVLKDGIVEYIPRFGPGDPYSRRLLDQFRVDLWRTSLFTDVVVQEIPREDTVPPVVDLEVSLETLTRNTYQGALGLGSDTGPRVQAVWGRHPLSRNGDRLEIGAGWQSKDNEYSLRGTYRLPRRARAREYWTSDLIIRHENLDLEVRESPDEDFIRLATGNVDERHLRLGRLNVRNFKSGEQQALETIFVQFLDASDEFRAVEEIPDIVELDDETDSPGLLKGRDNSVSIGFDYDLMSVAGRGWDTQGHRERAWIFGSSKSFGSDKDFLQAYVSTRRSYVRGENWKFIVRGEIGYSDAKIFRREIDVGDKILPLSVTDLPNFYRFKAGGSGSVRGYGFEELSDNHIGSNNIITASAEVEWKFLERWSAAFFYDVGNAFNDWSNPKLKRGIGIGVRWYSIAGPIRIDVAQALDLDDKPWRLHFTIGTPLL